MNNHSASLNCVAGILAGGHSRRLGMPKALLRLASGQTLIEHVVRTASEVCEPVVLLGRECDIPPPLSKLRILPDCVNDRGPLGGLCSLLEYAQTRWALLLACDMPLLSASLVQNLLDERSDRYDAIVYRRRDEPEVLHACCALYHPRALQSARCELFEGSASLQNILRQLRTCSLIPTEDQSRQLGNLNTPDDLQKMIFNSI